MRIRNFSLVSALVLFFSSISLCSASEYNFPIVGRSDIEQEIAISKLLPFYQYLGGQVKIQWANPELTPSITKIESMLVKEGIKKQDIVRNYMLSMSSKNQSRDSILLVLNTLHSRSDCLTYRLDISSKAMGKDSCAIDDNLDAMKIRK
ncbi:hypothetical protein [Tatumella ptyseos]|uniref:hypothetical protein n=1 Tax=Tatumella ptyseos TaxID=82987 RepID=UPI0026EC91B1|nr:hypothetical protein [Tatumella ptyseos]WKX27263.1 hypothetical protein QJR74_03720 [Tatumella ptyseos]